MEVFERELSQARHLLITFNLQPEEFRFSRADVTPDDDNPGMFVMRYEVAVQSPRTPEPAVYVGGLGLSWVDEFEADLRSGRFGKS